MSGAAGSICETSRSPEDTLRIGAAVGGLAPAGMVLALVGELGGGKTLFVKGLASGLGSRAAVTSPTFCLQNIYRGGRLELVHYDAYRLSGPAEFLALGAAETMDSQRVSAVEWADKVASALPHSYIRIRFELLGETERRLTFEPAGGADIRWVRRALGLGG